VKALVEVYNLCKQFGSIKALKNFSLTIPEEENSAFLLYFLRGCLKA
jgi:ABC-type branched-subunit amino acid transport system ATPase component